MQPQPIAYLHLIYYSSTTLTGFTRVLFQSAFYTLIISDNFLLHSLSIINPQTSAALNWFILTNVHPLLSYALLPLTTFSSCINTSCTTLVLTYFPGAIFASLGPSTSLFFMPPSSPSLFHYGNTFFNLPFRAGRTTMAASPLQSCLYTSIVSTSKARFSLVLLAWNLPFVRQLHHLHHCLSSRIILPYILTCKTYNSTAYHHINFKK